MPEARPSDMDDFIGDGVKGQILAFCAPNTAPANMPSGFLNPTRFYALIYNSNSSYDVYQRIIPRGLAGNSYERYRTGTTWSDWKEIPTDIPAFYKSYNNLTSFGTALAGLTSFATSLGENTGGIRYKRDSKTVSSTSDESFTIDVSVGGFGFLVARNDISGVCAIYACTRSTLVEIAPSPYVGAVKLNDTTIAVKAKQNAYLSLNYLIFGI